MSEFPEIDFTRPICPTVYNPLMEMRKYDPEAIVAADLNPSCTCEAGPQKLNLEIGGITLPIKDPRLSYRICGKILLELGDN